MPICVHKFETISQFVSKLCVNYISRNLGSRCLSGGYSMLQQTQGQENMVISDGRYLNFFNYNTWVLLWNRIQFTNT